MPALAPRLHLQRQRQAVALADASARAADRAARRVWAALWRAAADGDGWPRYVELLQLLMPSMRAAVGLSWRRLAVWAYNSEARLLAKSLPNRLTEDAEDDLLRSFLFDPPIESDVSRVLAPLLDPTRWAGGIGDRVRLSAVDMANQIAFGLSAGQTVGELKKLLTPYFEGSRTRAMRSARTFGLVAVQSMTREAHEQLGDLVVGYQVHRTPGADSRQAHIDRDGTIYWKSPGPGQKGLDELPSPPLESDGSVAFNCLCYTTPVLRDV